MSTASNIPTPAPSDPDGPVNPSTSTSASKPSSPSNCPTRYYSKINKRRSCSASIAGGRGQHAGHTDNTLGGSDNTLDNTGLADLGSDR